MFYRGHLSVRVITLSFREWVYFEDVFDYLPDQLRLVSLRRLSGPVFLVRPTSDEILWWRRGVTRDYTGTLLRIENDRDYLIWMLPDGLSFCLRISRLIGLNPPRALDPEED